MIGSVAVVLPVHTPLVTTFFASLLCGFQPREVEGGGVI